MVIVEVSLLTGFVLAARSEIVFYLSSESNLGEESKEQLKNELSFAFLPQLSHMSETYVLHLEREIGVTNLKPAYVRVYDYYHPGDLQGFYHLSSVFWFCHCCTAL
uniref:Alpha-macroglobulin receptor-binding domain-containing protein n=1 Tax=Meleagris gallopavo TaxID=9103 RepID=A0A803YQJ5_MELGA